MTKHLEHIKRVKALAETGLLYAQNQYDKERYDELLDLSYKMLADLSGRSMDALRLELPQAVDYPTAKVDIRALVLNKDLEILLTRESGDGNWSLPGGWADVGYSPVETAVKECAEETGLEVEVERLLAVFDKKMHPHPPQAFYVFKFVFLCRPMSHTIVKGFDVLDVRYFPLNELPVLSDDRILKSQIEMTYRKAVDGDLNIHVD